MTIVEQDQLILLKLLSSPPVFTGVRVTRSLVLYVGGCNHCLSFCSSSFGHCVVCPSSFGHCVVCPSCFGHCVVCLSFGHCVVCHSYIQGFWLALWYLQTLLTHQVSYSEWLSLWLLVRAKWTICYLHHGENNKQELQEKFCRRTKTALGPWRLAETSLKIEDFRSNKTTGKLS